MYQVVLLLPLHYIFTSNSPSTQFQARNIQPNSETSECPIPPPPPLKVDMSASSARPDRHVNIQHISKHIYPSATIPTRPGPSLPQQQQRQPSTPPLGPLPRPRSISASASSSSSPAPSSTRCKLSETTSTRPRSLYTWRVVMVGGWEGGGRCSLRALLGVVIMGTSHLPCVMLPRSGPSLLSHLLLVFEGHCIAC